MSAPNVLGLWPRTVERFKAWLEEPQPILRLELVRIFAPLAMLGFLSGRLSHADELLGESGFHVPNLVTDDYRQPLYLPPLPDAAAWAIAVVVVLSGLAVALGFRTRIAALVFALGLVWIAFADRLAAFTVTKLSPVLALAIFLSPAGARFGVDAWLAHRRDRRAPKPRAVVSGVVRFFQLFVPTFYCASGIGKAKDAWLREPYVLFTHVHDSYQTTFAFWIANATPPFLWTVLQAVVLTLELGAPLWFAWPRARRVALPVAVGMHVMIGLMFGPVKWFSLLMITLLLGAYLPAPALERIARFRRTPKT